MLFLIKDEKMKKSGFTLIELVFVLVVLGILAAIAIPKFNASRIDAIVSKGRSDVSAIRAAILNERQGRIIIGETNFIDPSDLSTNDTDLFNGVLVYPMKADTSGTKDGAWRKGDGSGEYIFRVDGKDCVFVYSDVNGTFTLKSTTEKICNKLVD